MRLEETAAFLRRHAPAFPIGATEAALLAIALNALAVIVDDAPHLTPNLIAGITAFLEERRARAH